MKKRKKYCAPRASVDMLFPDTFMDVISALLEYMPILKMPCMHENLVKKAVFLVNYAILMADEDDWDIKVERQEEVRMFVSFEEDLFQSPEERQSSEEIRKYENQQFINNLVSQHVLSLIPRKTKLKNSK